MAKTVLFDELIVTVRVPADLPASQVAGARQSLQGRPFLARLRRAVGAAFRAAPALARVRVRVGR